MKKIIFAFLITGCAACSFFSRSVQNTKACLSVDPTLEAQVVRALVDAAEQSWLQALKDIVPDEETRNCILEGIVVATAPADGGPLTRTLADGGVVVFNTLKAPTSAMELGETGKERVARRARTYIEMVK